jgi:hypothetical protein
MGELSDHDALYWQSGPSPQDVEKARLLLERRAAFRELVDGALATLRAEGLSVERVSAASLMAVQIMIASAQLGVTPATALTYATPDGLVKALRSVAGDPHAHAIRPTRVPGQRRVPLAVAGQLVAGLAQCAKFATANGDPRIADHAADLLSELGFALRELPDGADEIYAETGVFAEAGTLLREVASRIEGKFWSVCPCGQRHGQEEHDRAVVPAMRADAQLTAVIVSHG